MPRQVTGRCRACNIRYTWFGKPKLKNAYCPKCGMGLYLTTHLWKGANSTERPIELLEAVKLRRHPSVY